MKKISEIGQKILRLCAFTALFAVSLPTNAHLLGIAWTNMGDGTIRFYAETAHDGLTDVMGGSLQIGPWATREMYEWTGIINDTTFEELGIADMAYWDPDDPQSTLNSGNYATHAVDPGTYGNFFYVDVPNFVSGTYILGAQPNGSAIDRPLAWSYLNADILVRVPEPPAIALFGIGLLLMFMKWRNALRGNG